MPLQAPKLTVVASSSKRRVLHRKPIKRTANRKIKPKGISKLMKEADAVFSQIVRRTGAWMQDGELWNRCYTSGYEAPIKKLHCGHYLSRYYKSARWDFDNARPQSMMDNMWKRGDQITFRANLIKEIGEERVKAVEAKRNQLCKLTQSFLEETISTLKEKLKEVS